MIDSPTATPLAPPAPSSELQVSDYKRSPKDVLAVAWIGSHFEAAALRKGKVVSQAITRPGCDSSERFEAFLDATLEALGFNGSTAELMIDGGLLETANVTVPPVSNRLQQNFIREKAKRLKTGGAPVVWESQRIAAAKSGPRVLVHSIEKESLNDLESLFRRRGLFLKKVLPFMGSATRPFKDIQTPHDAASIVLAPVGSSYKILAIDHLGDLQFARDLNKENGTDPQRVAVEMNRCILFARQQFGKPVAQIVTVGLQAARFKAVIKSLLQGEVPISHRSDGKHLWLSQLSASNALNLAKESMVQDRRARLRKMITAGACLAAGTALVAFAYQAEVDHRRTQSDIARLAADEMRADISQAQETQEQAQGLLRLLADTEAVARPPVEQALINFLASHHPADTWTSELEIGWQPEEAAWTVRLLLLTEADFNLAQRRKEDLKQALRASPFAMQFPGSELERVSSIASRSSTQNLETLSIEGKIYAGGDHAE